MTPEKINLNEQSLRVADDCRLVTVALIKNSQNSPIARGALGAQNIYDISDISIGQSNAESILSQSSDGTDGKEGVAREPSEVVGLIVAGLSAQIQALELCASDDQFDLGTQRALIANGQEIANDVRQHLVRSTTPRPSDLDFKNLAEMTERQKTKV